MKINNNMKCLNQAEEILHDSCSDDEGISHEKVVCNA